MLTEFDQLVRMRQELQDWWNLRVTLAAYDRTFHKLRVDVPKPSMVAFCGQQYAGAKNYHDAPAFFVAALQAELQEEAMRIAGNAYEKQMKRLDELIESHRAAVLEQLSAK